MPISPRVLRSAASAAATCCPSCDFLSAQLEAYLTDGLWLANARHANAMARLLVAGLTALKAPASDPVEANEIFVVLPAHMHDALEAAGAQ